MAIGEIIDNLTLDAMQKYYTKLGKYGYVNQTNVFKLLYLSFVDDLLTTDFSYYITDCDYRMITNSLYCIFGTDCMFKFPAWNTNDDIVHKIDRDMWLRSSEDDILRMSEDNIFRDYQNDSNLRDKYTYKGKSEEVMLPPCND